MSRKNKNIITSLILIILIGLMSGTIYFASQSINSTNNAINMKEMGGTPPDMQNNNGEQPEMQENNSSEKSNKSESNRKTPPEKPSGDNGGEPPEKPNDDNSDNNQMTERENNNQNDEKSHSNKMETPKDMQNNNMSNNTNLNALYYVAFSIESLLIGLTIMYLLMSKFNKKSFKETFKDTDKIVIIVLSSIIITGGLTYLDGIITKTISNKNESTISNNNVDATASTTITSKKTLSSTYTSNNSDESAILVKNGGNATIKNATINKSKGDSTNTENSEFYGVNSGILVENSSSANITNSKITTSAKGSNAVFATGENAKITISDSTITTTGSSSARGLDATYGGTITANNVTITTQGGSCATLATDRGEGTVTAKNSKLETNGSGSPIIYSTGDITIEKTTGTANGSQMVVIEGKNSAKVKNSELTATAKGNRGDTDQAGIMIYQSMSGDASEGTGTFTATDSSLTIKKDSDYYTSAPMFFITNTDAVINLTNTKLSYGSNLLISAKGTSEWGKSGSNGGNVTLNAKNQTLTGNIEVDNISTLTMNLSNKTTYEGTINKDNNAKEINIKLDKDSKLILTGNSYIKSLEDEDESYSNIDFNGYTLYVNGTAIK